MCKFEPFLESSEPPVEGHFFTTKQHENQYNYLLFKHNVNWSGDMLHLTVNPIMHLATDLLSTETFYPEANLI